MGNHDSEFNRKHWAGRTAGFQYRNAHDLFPAEAVIFEDVRDMVPTGPVLDIGVGTGRTTPALRKLGRGYIGIDYSPEMIRRARARCPDDDFHVMDARDLSAFPNDGFALVCFSFNGIDYVSHDDRLRILTEIRRTLMPGGFFVFSSHNRDFRFLEESLRVPAIECTWHPAKLAYRLALHAWSRFNALRLGRFELRKEDYAILNDCALNHRLMTYYISPRKQRKQLATVGFEDIQSYDIAGRSVPPDADETQSYMVHYVCRSP